MSARLPENLGLIAAAPDGIKKPRGLILELAVRGKLVPQDPKDKPASELLKQIAAEKAQLVALCDSLKTDLAESRARPARLATTLIESALQTA